MSTPVAGQTLDPAGAENAAIGRALTEGQPTGCWQDCRCQCSNTTCGCWTPYRAMLRAAETVKEAK